MQEMSKFTAKRYTTQAADYNAKQLKACEVIKGIAENPRYNHHGYTVYSTSIDKLKKKKLYKSLTEDEIYELCVEYWSKQLIGYKDE